MNPWLCNLLFNNSGGVSLPTTGQTFYASLKNSLVPEVGTGGPTWSRATAAWRFNDIGLLRQIPSGCAEFGGARLVVNLAPRSEVINAGWILAGVTASDSNTVVESSGGTVHQVSMSQTVIGTFLIVVSLKRGAGSTRHVRLEISDASYSAKVNFNLDTGAISSSSSTGNFYLINYGADSSVDSEGYRRFYIRVNSTLSGLTSFYPVRMLSALNGSVSYSGDGTSTLLIKRCEIYDVTGRDASYVPEYVSVGVLSAPYHGAGADGCKYFTTDSQGAPIPVANLTRLRKESSATNNLLWSRDLPGQTWTENGGSFTPGAWTTSVAGSNLVTNGDFASDLSGWTNNGTSTNTWNGGVANLDGTGGAGGIYQTLTTTIGKTYLITVSMTIISGASNSTVSIKGATVGSTTIKYDGTVSSKSMSIIFKATLTNHVLYIATASGKISQVDDVVVKECTCIPERIATGLDGIANTTTTLTATATDAIILQPITLASAARCASAYVKRVTGTGTISFTQDGGSTWTDITSQINSSTWSRVQITSTLANPSVGFKISTSGDAIAVDCVQNEAGSVATSPIVTTTATVTRNADVLTYQTSGNIDFTVGTCYSILKSSGALTSRFAVYLPNGSSFVNSSNENTSWSSYDGVNTVSKTGLDDMTVEAMVKRVVAWGGSTQKVTGNGATPASGVFDGSWGSGATISIGNTVQGYVGDVAIYNYKMTDAELQAITT